MVSPRWRALPLVLLSACGPTRLVAPLRYDPAPAEPAEPFRAVVPDAAPVLPSAGLRWHLSALPNGLRIAVHERHGAPTVAVQLVFARGRADAAAGLEAIGTLGMVLDAGTALRTRTGLAAAYAQIGATHRTFIANDACGLGAWGGAADAEKLIALAAELASRPRLQPAEIADAKTRWAEDFHNSAGDDESIVDRNTLAALFGPAHPYGFVRPAQQEIDALGIERVTAVHARLFHPEHALLVVVGDVIPADIHAAAARAFGHWKPVTEPTARAPLPEPAPLAAPIVLVPRRRPQIRAAVVGRGPAPTDPDYAALEVLAQTLGGISARLHDEVRTARGAAYDFSAGVTTMRGSSIVEVNGAFAEEKVVPAIETILASIAEARAHGVPTADLERAKAALAARWRTRIGTAAGLASLAATAFAHGRPLESIADYPARIAAVTSRDVQDAALRWLTARDLHVVLVGSAALRPALEALRIGDVVERDEWARR